MQNKSWLACILLVIVFQASAQNTLKVQTGAILKTTGSTVITLQDMNLDNDGTISQAPGEGSFRFSGSTNNTISGISTSLFDIMEIAKTGSAKISLLQHINIGSGINFTSGLIDLNGKNILLQSTALLNSESELSRILGTTGGYVEITRTLNAPAAVNPGNLGAILTSSANMGSTIIRRGHKSQVNGYGQGNSILRYYDIIPANNTGLNSTLRFRYFDAELNGLNENTISFWKSVNTVTWSYMGFNSRDVAANYVEKTGIADHYRWALTTPGNPLPIKFSLFNVRCAGNKVDIHWKTAFEQNSSYFEVQRSDNGSSWVAIGNIPAAGYSSVEKTYAYTDNNPLPSTAFYRVAEFDITGLSQYTGIIRNTCGRADEWKVWPNPVTENLFINITAANSSRAMINLYDSKGGLVKQQQQVLLPGNNQIFVNMATLAKGIYLVSVTWNEAEIQKTIKVIRQ